MRTTHVVYPYNMKLLCSLLYAIYFHCKFFYDTRPDNGMFFYFDGIIYLHMAYGSADVNALRVLFHSYIQIKWKFLTFSLRLLLR